MKDAAIKHLCTRDARLKPWIDRIGPIELPRRKTKEPYFALLETIVYQQLHASAASTIWGRVLDLFPDRLPIPERLIGLGDDALRGAGLSKSKAMTMRAIAASALAGELPDAKSITRITEAEARERLMRIRGVGPWTVDMLLIFTLRRPDVMPLNDYGVRKAFKMVYRSRDLPSPAQLSKRAELWRPYRSTAALYLWKIADSAGGKPVTS